MSKLSDLALVIARQELGVKEETPNWGKDIKKYLNSVNINFPASWCAAFVYWCYNEAATKLAIKNPLTKTGGVIRHYNESTGLRLKDKKTTIPGDIFILNFGKGLGHTGIIESVDLPNNKVITIEGNSNNNGSREGIEVVRHERQIDKIYGILRYN